MCVCGNSECKLLNLNYVRAFSFEDSLAEVAQFCPDSSTKMSTVILVMMPQFPRNPGGHHFTGDEPNSNVMNKLTKKRSSLSLRYLYLAWDPMMALGNLAQKGNSSFNDLKTLTFHDRSCRTSPWSFVYTPWKVTISHKRPTLKTGLLTQGRPLLFQLPIRDFQRETHHCNMTKTHLPSSSYPSSDFATEGRFSSATRSACLMASSPTDVGWHAAMRVHRSNLDQTKAAGHLSRPGIWSYSLSLYRSTLELVLNYGVRDIYISKYPSPSIYQSKSLCLSVAFSLSLSVFLPACLNDWLTDWLNEGPKGQSKEEIIWEPTTIEPQFEILKNKKLPADLTPRIWPPEHFQGLCTSIYQLAKWPISYPSIFPCHVIDHTHLFFGKGIGRSWIMHAQKWNMQELNNDSYSVFIIHGLESSNWNNHILLSLVDICGCLRFPDLLNLLLLLLCLSPSLLLGEESQGSSNVFYTMPFLGTCLNNKSWLVVSTHPKNIRQNGNLPQIGVKNEKYFKSPLKNHVSWIWREIAGHFMLSHRYFNHLKPSTFFSCLQQIRNARFLVWGATENRKISSDAGVLSWAIITFPKRSVWVHQQPE